jgi:hypothetical protein
VSKLSEFNITNALAFHSLDNDVLIKAIRALEAKGRAELIEINGEKQGVKFF